MNVGQKQSSFHESGSHELYHKLTHGLTLPVGNWGLEKGEDLPKVTQQVYIRMEASDLLGLNASTHAQTPCLCLCVA